MAYPAAMGALSDSWSGGRKLGGNYYGGSFGKNYRAQSLQYKRALRQLTYRARRGDTNSTLAAIKLRDEANERGYTPVNQERGEFMKDMRGAYKSRIEAGQAMDRENALDRGNVNEGLGALEEMRRRREEEDKRREENRRKVTGEETGSPEAPLLSKDRTTNIPPNFLAPDRTTNIPNNFLAPRGLYSRFKEMTGRWGANI